MSATFVVHPAVDAGTVRVTGDDVHRYLRLAARLTVAEAGAVRRSLSAALGALPDGGRAVVDLGEVTELDAAGLAAVTAPVFANRRRGCRVTVLPPEAESARRFARIVGVLPIGVG